MIRRRVRWGGVSGYQLMQLHHDSEAGEIRWCVWIPADIMIQRLVITCCPFTLLLSSSWHPPSTWDRCPLPPREIRKSSTSFHVCSWHSFSLLGYTTKADSEAWDPTKARHGNFIVLHVLHCCSQVLSVFNHTQQDRLTASYWNQLRTRTYSVSQTKIIPWGFLKFYFPNGWKFLSKI